MPVKDKVATAKTRSSSKTKPRMYDRASQPLICGSLVIRIVAEPCVQGRANDFLKCLYWLSRRLSRDIVT